MTVHPIMHDPAAVWQRAPEWWRGAVIYQIYPRSFQDSNGDGIGDLNGIRQRLRHIAELGVDGIWISPFFTSPMKDFGYDVSNYCDVDPMFGTLEDFRLLLEEAHAHGLKVMIDLVISHTSDQHPWFHESRSSADNARADWYVWADAKPDGTAPNNWLSIFGGPAWEWDTTRQQYFLHNFLGSQPDLNFHNPDVQNALLDITRFWLELGVDGFRLDTINFYFHSAGLEDNPALPVDGRDSSIAPSVNPYNFQNHVYDKSRPENLAFLRRFRALLDEYPGAAAVGEVGDAQRGLELMADYTSGGDKVQMCYSFDFLSGPSLIPERVRKVVGAFEDAAPEGWACWAFSNHDVERHASRWGGPAPDPRYLKLLASVLLSLRGSVCLYQGEELGLPEARIGYEDLQDPYGIRFWPSFKGRDGCRTPMAWIANNTHGGFTTADKAWLPVDSSHLNRAADVQEHEADSMLAHYRAMLHFRKAHGALVAGGIDFLETDESLLAFWRGQPDADGVFCAFSFAAQTATLTAPVPLRQIDAPGAQGVIAEDNRTITLPPLGHVFARLVGH